MGSHLHLVAIALTIACGIGTACTARHSSERMPDGKTWTIENLDVDTSPSFCYEEAEANCRRYGRLYTWESAQRACQLLGNGWRLPTDDEWRQLASHYGDGKAAYTALSIGGRSGFNAPLGGGRSGKGQYERLEAHGFYWTASETGPATAWLYNFGKGGQFINRHSGIEKQMAVSVRCVRD